MPPLRSAVVPMGTQMEIVVGKHPCYVAAVT